MAQDQVELNDYHGRWLTEAEILLSRFFEEKHEDRANELRAKKMEREIMARSSLTATQQVIRRHFHAHYCRFIF